jgi:PmbA protein
MAQAAVDLAKKHGADEVSCGVSRSRGVDVEWRDGALERVTESTQRSLTAALYVDGRYSTSSTNDLRPDALDGFLAEAVAMTRLLEPDPHRALPDPERYEGRVDLDLDLEDTGYAGHSGESRRRQAEAIETALREAVGDEAEIVSISSGVSDGTGESARIRSNGFSGERSGTRFTWYVQMTLKDKDGRRPMGWSYTSRRHADDLQDVASIVAEAKARSLSQLGAGKLKTGRYTIVVENRAAPKLLGAFLAPLGGAALQQKRSLWEGRLGEQIASPLLTLTDNPHIVRGHGSALWDSDGFATIQRPILTAGVLDTYFIDQYYARKMGVEPTCGGTHNLEWALGDKALDGLVQDVGDGVLIERFLGGNSNETTGELSFGCAGRVIRNGQLAEPVAEVNLAGNFADIFKGLAAVGNDPDPNSASACPTLVFEDVQLSGV